MRLRVPYPARVGRQQRQASYRVQLDLHPDEPTSHATVLAHPEQTFYTILQGRRMVPWAP